MSKVIKQHDGGHVKTANRHHEKSHMAFQKEQVRLLGANYYIHVHNNVPFSKIKYIIFKTIRNKTHVFITHQCYSIAHMNTY